MSDRYKAPGRSTRLFNGVVAGLTRMGVSVWGSRILEVRGRRIGAAEADAGQPPWSTKAMSTWSRPAVRPTGCATCGRTGAGWCCCSGGAGSQVQAEELADSDKVDVLRAYLRRWKAEVGVLLRRSGTGRLRRGTGRHRRPPPGLPPVAGIAPPRSWDRPVSDAQGVPARAHLRDGVTVRTEAPAKAGDHELHQMGVVGLAVPHRLKKILLADRGVGQAGQGGQETGLGRGQRHLRPGDGGRRSGDHELLAAGRASYDQAGQPFGNCGHELLEVRLSGNHEDTAVHAFGHGGVGANRADASGDTLPWARTWRRGPSIPSSAAI